MISELHSITEHNHLALTAVFVVAFLYSAVGHGGASGYLAILSLLNLPPNIMASTALLLNTVVAGLATISYARGGYLNFKFVLPFILLSIPCAFLGGALKVENSIYDTLLSLCLIAAAWRLLSFDASKSNSEATESLPLPPFSLALLSGAAIGLLSGIVGIGGGIFLSPLIVLTRWGNAKTASATSALFIVVNSLAGLYARHLTERLDIAISTPFLPIAIVGGLLGSYIGAHKLSSGKLQKVLAIVLLIAAFKLLVSQISLTL